MYIDENENQKEKKNFSLVKNFILKLILIIIFVLLLVWLVPWPDMSGIKVLQEQIFNSNITTMKEAAIPYFTTERLPQKEGDKVTLTLQEMLDLHLLTPFVDKNGNTCDLKASYVSLEKHENEFVMKVNLKCSDKEDYILVHLGCYSYCQDAICEKQEDEVIPTTKPVVKPKPTPTTPVPTKAPTNVPTPTTSPTPTPTPTTTPTVKPTTTPTPTPTATPTPTPTDPIILPSPSTIPTPTAVPNIEYQYVKHTAAVYTEWSKWNVYSYTDNDVIDWENTSKYQIQDLGAQYVQVGTKTNTAKITEHKLKLVASKSYEVCTGVEYVATTDKLYQVTNGWHYSGREATVRPADTVNSTWELVEFKVTACEGTCQNNVYTRYKEKVRTVVEVTYTDMHAVCTSTETKKVDIYGVVPSYTTLTTSEPVYGYVKFYRDRTRELISKAKNVFAWSSSNNDKKLLDLGFKLTGETR